MGIQAPPARLRSLGEEIVGRVEELGAISETPGALTRVFLSPEHERAASLIIGWMREAGMTARLDAIGNVVGRYEAKSPGAPALLLGSHYDTVRDAGKWDGPLGIVTAIACVGDLNQRGRRLPFAIEVVGFADEEGVRFPATLLGSRALAGTFVESVLELKDAGGVRMSEAMASFGLDPAHVGAAARIRREFIGYLELHIEQGPVLEAENLPVGLVTAISGATRLTVQLAGMVGHAGTVPMSLRRDALAGAAECILAVEAHCRSLAGVVGTVGYVRADPGAMNVIPGHAAFTIDLRCESDERRRLAVAAVVRRIEDIARQRDLVPQIDVTHESRTAHCAPWIREQIAQAIRGEGLRVRELPSGAGHDGMAVIDVADIGMIFVRCRGGVSHSPAEHAELADVDAGARVMMSVIENFRLPSPVERPAG